MVAVIEFLTSLPRGESAASVYVILRKRSMSPWVPPYPVVRPEVPLRMAGNDFVRQMKFMFKNAAKSVVIDTFYLYKTAVLECLV